MLIGINGGYFPAICRVCLLILPLFTYLLFIQMCESMRTSVPIKNVSPGVMKIILDYVYAEPITVNAENVQELLPAASLLQLHS